MSRAPWNQIRDYTARMDALQELYWATYEHWLEGEATDDELDEAHNAWATEWLHGL